MKLDRRSRAARTARACGIALAEKELDYETVEIDLADRPEWLYELNPNGSVPVLDDGFILPESEVIMAYLDERYPERPLLPSDPVERAARGCSCTASTTTSATTTTHSAAATPNDLARQARRARARAEPVRRHRLRAVGDPGARHARRRASGAARAWLDALAGGRRSPPRSNVGRMAR